MFQMHGTALDYVLKHSPLLWGWVVFFFSLSIGIEAWAYSDGGISKVSQHAAQINSVIAYPTAMVGTLFSFMLGFFTNTCYSRFRDYWDSAVGGWSRLNDLGLQVYSYVPDRAVSPHGAPTPRALSTPCPSADSPPRTLPDCV